MKFPHFFPNSLLIIAIFSSSMSIGKFIRWKWTYLAPQKCKVFWMTKNISANKFLSLTRGDFDGWEFSEWEFSRGNFLGFNKYISYFLKTLLSFYKVFFWQFPHVFFKNYPLYNCLLWISHPYIIIFIEKWKNCQR